MCIRSVQYLSFSDVRAPSNCPVRCVDYPIGDCGGENAYNLFEFELGIVSIYKICFAVLYNNFHNQYVLIL